MQYIFESRLVRYLLFHIPCWFRPSLGQKIFNLSDLSQILLLVLKKFDDLILQLIFILFGLFNIFYSLFQDSV